MPGGCSWWLLLFIVAASAHATEGTCAYMSLSSAFSQPGSAPAQALPRHLPLPRFPDWHLLRGNFPHISWICVHPSSLDLLTHPPRSTVLYRHGPRLPSPAQSDWDPDVGFNDEAQSAEEAPRPPPERVMRVSAIPGTYALEYTFVGFCAVFGLVFLWGRRANARIAEAWYVLGCVDLRCSVKVLGRQEGMEVFTLRMGESRVGKGIRLQSIDAMKLRSLLVRSYTKP